MYIYYILYASCGETDLYSYHTVDDEEEFPLPIISSVERTRSGSVQVERCRAGSMSPTAMLQRPTHFVSPLDEVQPQPEVIFHLT